MKVHFTPVAFEDVAAISQSHGASVAARLEDAVFAATDRLAERPELGVATDDAACPERLTDASTFGRTCPL
jgi:plasmid stabilization system protein ParE